MQFSGGLRGNCYTAVDKNLFKSDVWISICVNEDGVRTAVGTGKNAEYLFHGRYLGYSSTEAAMGFGDGSSCTSKGQTLYRGALVKQRCGSRFKIIAKLTGKLTRMHIPYAISKRNQ